MSIKEYLKHRWYMFVIVLAASIFVFLVSWASDNIIKTDFIYIVEGVAISFIIYIFIDFIKLRTRLKLMNEYLDNNCSTIFKSNYPLDIKYAEKIEKIVDNFNKYKKITETEHNSELEFITKWVHDVKVPISAIKLIIENMDNDEAQHIEMQLSYIDQNIQKILYHIKSKRFYDDYKIKKVSIKSIVNHALKNYAVFFSYKSISLNIDCGDYIVCTDEKWSTYIVSQLISNAVKYTSITGEIVISTAVLKDEVALSIKNTGNGIEEKNINNIFKKGYSGYNTRKDKSTGYGLYLSKKLAEKMGHRLEAKSKPSEYAEFTIFYNINEDSTHYNNVS